MPTMMITVFLCICLVLLLSSVAASVPFIENDEKDGGKYAPVRAEFSHLLNEFDENGMTRLMVAAKTGQLKSLKDYIAGGADIHLETSDKNTALLLAVRGGFYYTSVELVRAKSNLNHKNSNGMTALLLAIVGGHHDIAVNIIDAGADPNIANASGSSALVMAAQGGSRTVVESLIRSGASLDLTSEGGDTALMFASATGHVEIVTLLLTKGAKVDIANDRGYTALIFAALRGHGRVIECIVQQDRSTLYARDAMGRAALDHAIASNRQSAVEALVALGAEMPRSGFRVGEEVLAKRAAFLAELNKPVVPRVKHGEL